MDVVRVRTPPGHVVVEQFTRGTTDSSPYRGVAAPPALRMRVEVATPGLTPHEVVIEIGDVAIEVRTPHPTDAASTTRIALGTLEAVFVVERPPRVAFLTWFGVFARRPGCPDQLVLEHPELEVARYVEHVIEEWLGIRTSMYAVKSAAPDQRVHIQQDDRILLVRRSQTFGDEVMETVIDGGPDPKHVTAASTSDSRNGARWPGVLRLATRDGEQRTRAWTRLTIASGASRDIVPDRRRSETTGKVSRFGARQTPQVL